MKITVERHYVRSRYGQLHYVRAEPAIGTPAAPPLVLLHQNPSSSLEYYWLIRLLATDRVVLALDTPGYGGSDAPPGPLTAGEYAAIFADATEQVLGERSGFDAFGFHTGTMHACELALASPDRVGRLILIGVPYRSPTERVERLASIHATPPLADDGADLFKRLHWLWDFTVTSRRPGVPIERAAEIFIDRARTLNRYWWPYDAVWRWPIEERLPLIRQPVLVLQADAMLRKQSAAACLMLANGRLQDLPLLDRDIFEPAGGVDQLAAAMRAFLV